MTIENESSNLAKVAIERQSNRNYRVTTKVSLKLRDKLLLEIVK